MSSMASRAAAADPGPVMAEYTEAWSFKMPILTGLFCADAPPAHEMAAKSAKDTSAVFARVILFSLFFFLRLASRLSCKGDICQYLYMNATDRRRLPVDGRLSSRAC